MIIGIHKFSDPSIPELTYAAKDAEDFRNYLITKANFAPDHILLLQDEKASKNNIMDAVGDGWLPQRVAKDDLVVIFISTHGTPTDDAGENFIAAADTKLDKLYSSGIRLQDLPREVTRQTGCDRLVMLLDACHSGAVETGAKGIVRTAGNIDVNSLVGTGQVVISSSQKNEKSWESKRNKNSVFTACLIDALQHKGPETKLIEAYNYLKDHVEQEVRFDRKRSQTPDIKSLWQGEPLTLAIKPASPRIVLPDLPLDQDPAASEPPSNKSNTAATNSQAAPETAASLNGKAVKAIQAHNYDEAVTYLMEALKIDPTYKYARANLCTTYNNQAIKLFTTDPQKAKRLIENALAWDPTNQTALRNLQRLQVPARQPGTTPQATASSQITAPVKTPSDQRQQPTANGSQSAKNPIYKTESDLDFEQACYHYKKCAYSEALKFFDRELLKNPNNAEAYNGRANTYIHIEQDEKALNDADQALKLKPDFAEAYYTRALALYSLNHFSESISACSIALGLKPRLKAAYTLRANNYEARKETSLAEQDRIKAKALSESFDEPLTYEWKGEPDFTSYMADVQRRAKRAWFPPKSNVTRRVVVKFKLHHDGTVSNIGILTSSQDPATDKAGIAAIESSAPMRPLPPGAPPNVDVALTFDYTIKDRSPATEPPVKVL